MNFKYQKHRCSTGAEPCRVEVTSPPNESGNGGGRGGKALMGENTCAPSKPAPLDLLSANG